MGWRLIPFSSSSFSLSDMDEHYRDISAMVQGTLQSLILTGIPASCNCPITDQAHTPEWILGNIILRLMQRVI